MREDFFKCFSRVKKKRRARSRPGAEPKATFSDYLSVNYYRSMIGIEYGVRLLIEYNDDSAKLYWNIMRRETRKHGNFSFI